ncbi:MAG TPA: alpha/beta hydrolase-fold protein, partial [Anaerolineae bacterium]|nr:alpha/beta hydrolase-fold protein [Anaerolineae bacterium]
EDSRGGVMYLVAGTKRALLIDTGWGTGDLRAHVATLTSLPLLVVNTHGHRDHVSGNEQFPEVHIHTNDLPLVQGCDTVVVPIYDGYRFDLGEREIQVIGVPGHSPGSICLLDPRARILFSGDSPRPGPVWLHVGTALTVADFRQSLARLQTFAGEFDTIAPSHGKPVPVGSLLGDLTACADKVLSGELIGEPQETRFGPCLLASLEGAEILYKADGIHRRLPWARGERLISPEVHADRTVTFRVKAPNSESVLLASGAVMNALGSADNALAFQGKDEGGVWSLTLGPLPPDIYDYVYLIDGVPFADGHNAAVQTGVMPPRSLLVVPAEEGSSYYEARDVPHGVLHCHYYASKSVGDVRDLYVYTPPGYEESPGETYPVLYLLHGGGDDAGSWSGVGRVHLMMDNLLAEGKAEPMIIAMPYGQAVPVTADWEERRQRNTSLFEQDFFADVLPLVESVYRVQADRDHRAMVGLSMGGGQTDQIALQHLDTFSYVGILSAGMYGLGERHAELLADPAAANEQLNLLFLGCGTLDPLAFEGMNQAHALLTEVGVEHVYWTLEGTAHTWVVWRAALCDAFLPMLWRGER